jgi:hypothetical protein
VNWGIFSLRPPSVTMMVQCMCIPRTYTNTYSVCAVYGVLVLRSLKGKSCRIFDFIWGFEKTSYLSRLSNPQSTFAEKKTPNLITRWPLFQSGIDSLMLVGWPFLDLVTGQGFTDSKNSSMYCPVYCMLSFIIEFFFWWLWWGFLRPCL